MKVAGIIAEYNPFHNGHLYQLEQIKQQLGADHIVIAMSGDFVQRGEPAIYDKYTRTRMALNAGADLVLELPVCFATSSAEDFAMCGVSLLDKLGIVDVLCFGSECGELDRLSALASVLLKEPEAYQQQLKALLKQGFSYPLARNQALSTYLSTFDAHGFDTHDFHVYDSDARDLDTHDLDVLLSSSNNILGIEYLKALQARRSAITPFTIRRKGQDYNDAQLPPQTGFPSATAIRNRLKETPLDQKTLGLWTSYLPTATLEAVFLEDAASAPVFLDDFSSLLQYCLLDFRFSQEQGSSYADFSPELAARLKPLTLNFATFSERIRQLKTKQYTYTRISRALLHLILGITNDEVQLGRALDHAPYARILGFKKSSAPLLGAIKKNAEIPLITKVADANTLLSPEAYALFSRDLYASHLYQSVVFQKGRRMKNEYTKSVIVLP